MTNNDPMTVNLSLVSHTNAGKTTLARTLLGQDVGEVGDSAHVTQEASDHVLVRSPTGATLVLWDTPGFGNSERLAERLEQTSNPIGWLISQVWDRWAGRSLFYNQKVVRHIRDTSCVILYLVNAAESEEAGRYLPSEMKILGWVGKPVIVLLNQLGSPKPQPEEIAEVERWRAALAPYPFVKNVLPLDAFARCWVQEGTLLQAIGDVLPPELKDAYEELRTVWVRRKRALFNSSMEALGVHLTKVLRDAETVSAPDIKTRMLQLANTLRLTKAEAIPGPLKDAQTALAARASDSLCALTDKLLEINDLHGKGIRRQLLSRLRRSDLAFSTGIGLKEGSIFGAVLTGAASGLAADMVAGGLTFGLGALIGSVVGALGGAGTAYAYNTMTGRSDGEGLVYWGEQAFRGFVAESILLYLTVAHFGRGRGDWVEGESPAFWVDAVNTELAPVEFDMETLRAKSVGVSQSLLIHVVDNATRAILTKFYGRGDV